MTDTATAKINRFSLCLAAATAMMLATPARANLIANGNFETGTLTGFNKTGNVAIAHVPFFGFSDSGYGNYFAAFNAGNQTPNGSLSQSFATTVGQQYTLAYNYGVNGATQSITASVTDSAALVLASGVATASSPAPNSFSLSFTADTATTTVTFTDSPSNPTVATDGGLDNISVDAPEPSSLAVMAGALLVFAGVRRRSNRRT
jgi:hypothetical protein